MKTTHYLANGIIASHAVFGWLMFFIAETVFYPAGHPYAAICWYGGIAMTIITAPFWFLFIPTEKGFREAAWVVTSALFFVSGLFMLDPHSKPLGYELGNLGALIVFTSTFGLAVAMFFRPLRFIDNTAVMTNTKATGISVFALVMYFAAYGYGQRLPVLQWVSEMSLHTSCLWVIIGVASVWFMLKKPRL